MGATRWFSGLHPHRSGLGLGLALLVGMAVVTLALAVAVVALWPADRFRSGSNRRFLQGRHPVLRGLAIGGKNLAGLVLVGAGVAMAVPGVPGQGFLTILIGLTLLDFPGKRRFERALVGRPAVLAAINRIRARAGKPPIVLD